MCFSSWFIITKISSEEFGNDEANYNLLLWVKYPSILEAIHEPNQRLIFHEFDKNLKGDTLWRYT